MSKARLDKQLEYLEQAGRIGNSILHAHDNVSSIPRSWVLDHMRELLANIKRAEAVARLMYEKGE